MRSFLMDGFLTGPLLDWLLTYALHSSLLLAGVWVISRLLGKNFLSIQELLWKTALVGGLITASLQTFPGIQTVSGSWTVQRSTTNLDRVLLNAPPQVTTPDIAASNRESSQIIDYPVMPTSEKMAQTPESSAVSSMPISWRSWVVALWLIGATGLSLLLAASYRGLYLRLRCRKEISDGSLLLTLAKLWPNTKSPIRLTRSEKIHVPIAQGFLRPEICIPGRALKELDAEQQEAMLAHEMAHHLNRDPLWLLLTRALETLFFFQPLNRMARKRLQEIAEYRCDDWTVTRTGRPLIFARCLTEVAEWSLAESRLLPVPGMAEGKSGLGKRIHRLLKPSATTWRRPPWLRVTLPVMLLMVAFVAPNISSAERNNAEPLSSPATTDSAKHTKTVGPESALKVNRVNNTGNSSRQRERTLVTRVIKLPAEREVIQVDGGTNGGISVSGYDGDEIVIEAKLEVWSREQGERIADNIQIVTDGVIHALGPKSDRNNNWAVSYNILAPQLSNLNLTALNGGIRIADIRGNIRFETTNGGIELVGLAGDVLGTTTNGSLNIAFAGDRWNGSGLDVETTNGGVVMRFPEDYAARLETGTVNGQVQVDFPILVQGRIDRRIVTELGDGGTLVKATTTNGGVRLKYL